MKFSINLSKLNLVDLYFIIHISFTFYSMLSFNRNSFFPNQEKYFFDQPKFSFSNAAKIEPIQKETTNQIDYIPDNYVLYYKNIFLQSPPHKLVYVEKGFAEHSIGINSKLYLSNKSNFFRTTKTIHYVLYSPINLPQIYGSSQGSLAFGDSYFAPPKSHYGTEFAEVLFYMSSGILEYVDIDELLILGHAESLRNYAHFLLDKLVNLMLVPDDIRERSYVLCDTNASFTYELLLAVGFRETQILPTKDKRWFLTKKIHIFTNYRPLNNYGGPPALKLHHTLSKYYHLETINATNYCMINRKSKSRNILNFNEIFKAVKVKYSKCNWIEIPDFIDTVEETARVWASLRLVYVMTGSSCAKGIFMHENTVLCIPTCEFIDHTIMNLLVGSNHAVYIYYTGFQHFATGSFPISVENTLNAIFKCIYYDKKGKWPSITIIKNEC